MTRKLTPPELVALRHLAEGLTNREIAEAMGLTPDAIRVLLDDCCEALGVNSREGLAVAARDDLGL